MIYITQLIYIKEGEEAVFELFESYAIPIISNYNGKLLLRIRPEEQTIIENNMDVPYEIHFVAFDTEEDFQRFLKDEERKKFLHLKEKSIQTTLLLKGEKI